nr:hypothetical protein [Tanacetum cinerariifolium]
MASLADKAILSGADNRPPMLEKDMYDSWKSRMKLTVIFTSHCSMASLADKAILSGADNRPLMLEKDMYDSWKTDCDVKATNIILQGLPPEVYALFSTHKVAKELWERI